MTFTKDEEQFKRSCTQLGVFSPAKNKPISDAHSQLQTAKTREGYGLARLLKDTEKRYGVLIHDVGTKMIVPKKRSTETETFPFFFYVDNVSNALKNAEECLHFHICAYLDKGWTVLRETKFNVSPLALLPYRYEYTPEDSSTQKYHIGLKLKASSGISEEYVSKEVLLDFLTKTDSLKLTCTFYNVPYDSQWSDGQYRQEFVCLATFEQIDVQIIDDYGQAINSYNESAILNSSELPEELAGKTFSLENKDLCAPLTTSSPVYCLLYADKRNLVRVYRWLPVTKANMKDEPILPLHELGSVSQAESEELFNQMVSTQNTLLFGKVENDRISVICNMNGYYDSELSGYVLPSDLFNLAK